MFTRALARLLDDTRERPGLFAKPLANAGSSTKANARLAQRPLASVRLAHDHKADLSRARAPRPPKEKGC